MSETPEPLPARTERPWGSYTVLVDNPTHKVKSITVKPGQRLSLQRHAMRKEYWTVVEGTGLISTGFDVEDLDTELLTVGDTFEIPPGMIHRMQAGGSDLTFIEVQLGAYFGEDDLERLEDDYERTE